MFILSVALIHNNQFIFVHHNRLPYFSPKETELMSIIDFTMGYANGRILMRLKVTQNIITS